MAETSLNTQIVDSVAAANFINIGGAPASAQALLDAVMSETLGMAMHNAVMRQQANSVVSSAATTATCARILQAGGGAPPPPAPPYFPIEPGPVIPPLDGPEVINPNVVMAKASAEVDEALNALGAQAAASQQEAVQAQTEVAQVHHVLDGISLKLTGLINKPKPNA